jgi:Uma2 family endonuclease
MSQTLSQPPVTQPAAATPRPVEEEPVDRRWTRQEYDQLVDLGLFDGQRLELVEGRIIQMSPQNVSHRVGLELMDRFVRKAFPSGHRVCIQMPFRAADGSEPEPDVAVIPGDPRGVTGHPSHAVLIVEVSDTTLRHDRNKARLYAASGVGDYWILNLVDRTLELYRDPLPGGGPPAGPAYATMRVLRPQDSIAPLAVPGCATTITDLFP